MYDIELDQRIKCLSIMTSMKLSVYLDLVEAVYVNQGGLENQRGPLKTKTGVAIRNRMVCDIQDGTVLPPVVLGVLVDSETEITQFGALRSSEELISAIPQDKAQRLSIIDGMQRTTDMKEALLNSPNIANKKVRVEFWIAQSPGSLIYRMLILNSGQVPWELSRQLQTVYTPFLLSIKQQLVDIEIFTRDDRRRRSAAGQYQGSNIIELLLIFSSRRTELDIRDKVAEDFARLDAIESTAHAEFLEYFVVTLRLMSKLDHAFSRVELANTDNTRFKSGKDIFSSFPAMVGFCSAVSICLFDEPGFKIDWDGVAPKMHGMEQSILGLTERMRHMSLEELCDFVQLELLEEKLSQRSGQVGRFERDFFNRAFSSLIRNADRLTSMEPCWKA